MYFYFVDENRVGPIDEKAIVALIQTGKIDADSLVQKDGWKSPKPAFSVFKNHFKIIPANAKFPDTPGIAKARQEAYTSGLKMNLKLRRMQMLEPYAVGAILIGFLLFLIICIATVFKIAAVVGVAFMLFTFAMGIGLVYVFNWDRCRQTQKQREELAAQRIELDQEKIELEKERIALWRPEETITKIQADALAVRYLEENIDWISYRLNSANYPQMGERLAVTINSCRVIGYAISEQEVRRLNGLLQEKYQVVLRREAEKEEQARIREQMREEQKAEKELRALQEKQRQVERERAAIEKAIREALANANGVHNQQIAELERQLADKQAEIDAGQRTLSNAELGVKAGHVYVVSNIGSFGEDVFKIGMTRRFEPVERIDELGGASVPFPFDIHMMIACQDAPALENSLHRALHHFRVNKVNLRKEYFRTDRATIERLVEQHHGKVEYLVCDDFAEQYFNSQKVTPEMEAEIEKSFEGLPDLGD